MPNVISDTSPIQYLYQTDLLKLLPTPTETATPATGIIVIISNMEAEQVPILLYPAHETLFLSHRAIRSTPATSASSADDV